jgi:N6-adenosine-specific RNA methylase IME4
MSKKFSIIVADPPYGFKDSLKMSNVKRGAQANYDTMTMQEIRELPVKDYCHPDGAVLCLWVPSSLLQDGLDTMKAWGFKHKQTYVWVKIKKQPFKGIFDRVFEIVRSFEMFSSFKELREFILDQKYPTMNDMLSFGMGRLFRQTHEICLIGISNNKIYKQLNNKSQRSVSFAENLKHSAKPECLQNSLEIMFPTAYKLELFARRIRPGWTCLGNEIDGKDIRDVLSDL